mmetsp:Transcript_15330/g.31115  ORF Transcript_15330/g.31115 Transcript_15330/m.31115 type:complete len:281 (-) Transcript_15330:216-1058(-)
MRSGHRGGEFSRLSDVFAHILIIPHQNLHPLLRRHVPHLLQLLHRRSARLLQINALAPGVDALLQQARIVRRPSRNERHARLGRRREFGHRGEEGGRRYVRGGGIGREGGGPVVEFGAAGSFGSGAEEPRLDDVVEGGGGASSLQHLNGVIPPHSPIGGTAPHQDHFGLSFLRLLRGRCGGRGDRGGIDRFEFLFELLRGGFGGVFGVGRRRRRDGQRRGVGANDDAARGGWGGRDKCRGCGQCHGECYEGELHDGIVIFSCCQRCSIFLCDPKADDAMS